MAKPRQYTHTQKPHVRQTEEEVEAEAEVDEERYEAMRCVVMNVWDEMMNICNGLIIALMCEAAGDVLTCMSDHRRS